MPGGVKICSLQELEIELSTSIRQHLSKQYKNGDLEPVLQAMKRPPVTTVCRVNQILATRQDVVIGLREAISNIPELEVLEDVKDFDDVVYIIPKQKEESNHKKARTTKDDQPLSFASRGPSKNGEIIFSKWPSREEKGWPMTHRAVLCDRFCGEAVLRGSDIFVRGILAADSGISKGETVAVYADIRDSNSQPVSRGLNLDNYAGKCVFLGLGTMACCRSDIFKLSQGVAICMSRKSSERVGPCAPPLSGILQDKMMLQNLPSIVVGHALDPKPNETILDMCAAPGGKSSHLASLVRNQATIVSCDKSRKKIVAAKALFERQGATCIVPIAWDSTDCVERDFSPGQYKSAKEVSSSDPVYCILFTAY